MTDILEQIQSLPTPTVIDVKRFETLLAENILLAKEVLGSDWKPLESDQYMKKLRVLTLRQMHNQADKNETIKQLLITTATGVNLDHLGLERGVIRDKGEKPRATVRFTLSTILPYTVTIPAGTMLNGIDKNGQQVNAFLLKNLIIEHGELSIDGSIELDKYLVTSEVKCENIVTDIPFVVNATQITDFTGGYEYELDDDYRVRIILSLAKYSTAGCINAYKFFSYSADSRIDDVVVHSNKGEVYVVIHSFTGVDDAMLERVKSSLSSKDVRPISDNVIVKSADVIEVEITLIIELEKLLESRQTDTVIRSNFNEFLFIGQNLILSDVLRKSHLENVYRVSTDFTDIITNNEQIIKITKLNLSYIEVQDE